MATLGDFREAADRNGGATPVTLINEDGDEVNYTVEGYTDEDETFVLVISNYEVSTPDSPPVTGQVITVTAPEGVEVNVVRQSD